MPILLSVASEKLILSNQKASISSPEGTHVEVGLPSHGLHQRGVQKITVYTSPDNTATIKLSSREHCLAIGQLPDGRVITAQRIKN